MDRTQHKLAMEFFRSEIKTLAKRIDTNKQALRHNQRIVSKKLDEPTKEYDKSGERYWWCAENAIRNDKDRITCMHIAYGQLRGKPHLNEEREKEYAESSQVIHKRMEEYVKEKQAALVPECACGTGGI
jgi:hypothetical protein